MGNLEFEVPSIGMCRFSHTGRPETRHHYVRSLVMAAATVKGTMRKRRADVVDVIESGKYVVLVGGSSVGQ